MIQADSKWLITIQGDWRRFIVINNDSSDWIKFIAIQSDSWWLITVQGDLKVIDGDS